MTNIHYTGNSISSPTLYMVLVGNGYAGCFGLLDLLPAIDKLFNQAQPHYYCRIWYSGITCSCAGSGLDKSMADELHVGCRINRLKLDDHAGIPFSILGNCESAKF